MRVVFADTSYYIALTNPADDRAAVACEFTRGFAGRLVTTVWVLTEVANHLSHAPNRSLACSLIDDLRNDPRVTIVAPTMDCFSRGFALYGQRPDKNWSLTDCTSFVTMQDRGIREALTGDHHFEQAGFVALLR